MLRYKNTDMKQENLFHPGYLRPTEKTEYM